MTDFETRAILQAVQKISDFARLEDAIFDFDFQNDKEIKRAIRPYMLWFNNVSYLLSKLCEAEKNGGRYAKRDAIDEFSRYCR